MSHDLLSLEHFQCGPLANNIYLLIDPAAREFVVIDPSMESEPVLVRARELIAEGFQLRAIWNTHGHFDHIFDNHLWKKEFDVPLLMHADDTFFVERLRDQAMWFGFAAPDEILPDESLSEGQILHLGCHEIHVWHTPGHSPGSVSFYAPQSGFCVSGDVIFKGSAGRTDLPGCSAEQLQDSLRRLLELPGATRLLPGHDALTTVEHERRTNPFRRALEL
jgi:hydroxyacylglutathione hydrolase